MENIFEGLPHEKVFKIINIVMSIATPKELVHAVNTHLQETIFDKLSPGEELSTEQLFIIVNMYSIMTKTLIDKYEAVVKNKETETKEKE